MTELEQVRERILQRSDIVAHAERAGFRRRGRAWFCGFHEDRKHPSASVRNGRVHCFVCNRTWNVVDLTMELGGLGFVDALRQLAAEGCIPWPGSDLSPAERADFVQRRRAAESAALPLAQRGWWWLRARIAELNEMKVAAVGENRFDVDVLAPAASEIHRLETLTPGGLVREYVQFQAEHPAESAELVGIGRAWEQAWREIAESVVRYMQRDQRRAPAHAA